MDSMDRRTSSDRCTNARRAGRLALCAMLTALSLVCLTIATAAPSGRLGLTALAGLFPAAAVVSYGLPAGFLCYVGTALLALLFLADKAVALLYVLFLGIYPMVKGLAERLRSVVVELVLKLGFFNLMFTVALYGFSGFLTGLLFFSGQSLPLFYLFGNVIFLLYDFGFSQVIEFYRRRIDKVLRKN